MEVPMATQVYPVNQNQTLRLVVNGDLFLSGSNQSQVKLSVDEPRDLVVRLEGELVDVLCRDDVIVTIPDTMPVVVSTVSGDCDLRDIQSSVQIGQVGGDLTGQRLGRISIEAVGGDCEIRQVAGEAKIRHIGGDFLGVELSGVLTVDGVGGDVDLITHHGDVSIRAGGDVTISLADGFEGMVDLRAGADVTIGLPASCNVKLDLTAGRGEIVYRWGGERQIIENHQDVRTIGNGNALIQAKAGDEVIVMDQLRTDERWQRGFDRQEERWQRAQQRVRAWERATDETNRRIAAASERAARKAEEAARRAEQRVQETMKRIEQRKHGWSGMGGVFNGVPVKPPSRVSDDERRLILQMLAEKKITAEEADRLLRALENLGDQS